MTGLPRAARVADAVTLALLSGAAVVAVTGGFSAYPWGIRMTVTSHARLVLLAAAVCALRHVSIRRPTLWERLAGSEAHGDIGSTGPAALKVSTTVLVVAFFTLLTCLVAFEQVLQIRGVADLGDPLFSVWRLDWVAYQLVHDPGHLFDANIFHPEPRTLAYSDAMLVPALIAAPFIWLGLEPVVVHNVLMLAASALSGVTMFCLVRELSRSTEAALVGGVVFALTPVRWALYSHLELQVTAWMPLALLYAHRTFRDGRWRDGLLTGVAVALQALSSLYYGMFLSVFVAVAAPVLAAVSRPPLRRVIGPLAAGAALAAAMVGTLTLPYFRNRATVGERQMGEVASFSANGRDYLSASPRSRWYAGTALSGGGGLALFPGATPIALAAAAVVPPLGPGGLAYVVATAVAADASTGVSGVVYPALYRTLLPFRGLRAPDRFGVLVSAGVAVLAGLGAARLLRRVGSHQAQRAVTAGLIALVAVESSPALHLTDAWPGAPPVYGQLPPGPDIVLVDLPFPQRDGPFEIEYAYLQFATTHHRRLVNGGSGFYPRWYDGLAALLKDPPGDEAIAALRRHGVRYAVVHGAFYGASDYRRVTAALDRRSDVRLVATAMWTGAEDRLYDLLPTAPAR